MAHDYAGQKLWEAVHQLVGDGSIHARLEWAASYLVPLKPDEDLPEGQCKEFKDVMYKLTPLGNEGPIRKMSSEEAGKVAERILSIYAAIHGGI
jgi:hypothetical protein